MNLRLGVMCAVIDENGNILLSRRGDLNTWTLPGGRLDVGEHLEAAAMREVQEETGISVTIERAAGLYYLADWRRMNVLFVGRPQGGRLQDKTRETRANRYFTEGSLPQKVIGAKEALGSSRPQKIIVSTPAELRRLKLRFGWRWVYNRLSGHPEPKFPVFNMRAVAVLIDEVSRRVLTLPGPGYNAADSAIGFRMLPRVACDGEAAPWDQLALSIQQMIGVTPGFQWVGLWEDTERAMIEFVFAATLRERDLPGSFQWTTSRNAAFSDRDLAYVERVKPSFARDPIWSIVAREEPSDLIMQEAKL